MGWRGGKGKEDFCRFLRFLTYLLEDLAKLLDLTTGAQARLRNFRTSTTGALAQRANANENHSHLEGKKNAVYLYSKNYQRIQIWFCS